MFNHFALFRKLSGNVIPEIMSFPLNDEYFISYKRSDTNFTVNIYFLATVNILAEFLFEK